MIKITVQGKRSQINEPFPEEIFRHINGKKFTAELPVHYLPETFSAIRKGIGLNEKEVGTKIGVHQSILLGMDEGSVNMNLWNIMHYAYILGLEISITLSGSLDKYKKVKRGPYLKELKDEIIGRT